MPVMNMYESIRDNLHFNKFTVGEVLFVEYKCPIEQDTAGVWTPMDYSHFSRAFKEKFGTSPAHYRKET